MIYVIAIVVLFLLCRLAKIEVDLRKISEALAERGFIILQTKAEKEAELKAKIIQLWAKGWKK